MAQRLTPKGPLARQRGVALITALVIVAVASLMAVRLITQQQAGIQRTQQVLHHAERLAWLHNAEQLALATLQAPGAWARLQARLDARREAQPGSPQGQTAGAPPGCRWPLATLEVPALGGPVQLWLEDLHCRLNLSGYLRDPAGRRTVLAGLGALLEAQGVAAELPPAAALPGSAAAGLPRLQAPVPALVSRDELGQRLALDAAALHALWPHVVVLPRQGWHLNGAWLADPVRRAAEITGQTLQGQPGSPPRPRWVRVHLRWRSEHRQGALCSDLDLDEGRSYRRQLSAC